VAGAPTDRRSGAIARLLTGGRRSPEGECIVVEQLRCDALSWEPKPVNPRVGTGEPQVPGLAPASLRSPSRTPMRSDLVTVGPGKSRGRFFSYARVSKIWGSFHFSFDPVLIDSNPN
jgi:hypothetical protein